MVTAEGCGYSQWHDLSISRWHSDPVRGGGGSALFIRDRASGVAQSATWWPVPPRTAHAGDYAATFRPNRAHFERQDGALHSVLDIAPLPSGDGELRRLTLHNRGTGPHGVDVISWVPLVLGAAAADAAHPAFARMFVQTEAVDDGVTLLAWRRKSTPDDFPICAAHLCTSADTVENSGFETDRLRFIGRGRDLCNAEALAAGQRPDGRAGTVLDPVFSLRRRITLAPDASATLVFWTLAAADRKMVLARAAQCRQPGAAEQALQAWQDLRPAAPEDTLQGLSAALLYPIAALRAAPDQIAQAAGGAPVLWAHGVSGDRPIVLARLHTAAHAALARELDTAQAWWQAHGIAADVVLVCDADAELQRAVKALPAGNARTGRAGQRFVLNAADLTRAQDNGLSAAARIVLDAAAGDLAAQANRPGTGTRRAPVSRPCNQPARVVPASIPAAYRATLEYFNGLGGFAEEGRSYVIHVTADRPTPMPWINVIANERFGFTVSESGGGYAWATNSQKNALTPWSNDPVRDPPGDVLYLSDCDRNTFWSATPAPVRTGAVYEVRHRPGSTRFVQEVDGIATELVQFVPVHDAVKFSVLTIRNRSRAARTLRITGYVHWHLGGNGDDSAPFIVTAHDAATGALTARNDWRTDYAGRVAFADLRGEQDEWTCDRREFLGCGGSLAAPAALQTGVCLGQRCGAGIAPCAALATTITLAAGAERELVLVLGEGGNLQDARALIQRCRETSPAHLLGAVTRHWDKVCNAVQVQTPDHQLDLLVNAWLPYQIISCRLHARTAFYQASGAYGFRDQLQDVSALTLSAPRLVREHLLRAASRQFAEGDVQHWWLPPSGAGVRTHMVDDRLWLPLVTAHYVAVTGDQAVLDECVPFLKGKPLPLERADDFYVPEPAGESASLFEHCARAIEASLTTGRHGIPLFGTGDWNDGMNRVGRKGEGESVWMGWFLIAVIRALAPIAEARGADRRAGRWRQHAGLLAQALETHAWDGQWWLRGWYDDGTPLGSHADSECRIDGIAQSWSVMAQAANPERARQAMEAVDRLLVRRDAQMVDLLTPPFDTGDKDPGYIRGYPPGLRENGGQYTHGSTWAVVAFAMLGDGDRAWELFHMLSPVAHATTLEEVARWQVEPYVACGDVYTAPQHLGRGGWSWYTGSAGWLYRAATEWLLGLQVRGATLRINPCIPHAWPGFALALRWRNARYDIEVDNAAGVCHGVVQVQLDGQTLPPDASIALHADGACHALRVVLG